MKAKYKVLAGSTMNVLEINGDIAEWDFSDKSFSAFMQSLAGETEMLIKMNSWGGDPRIASAIARMIELSDVAVKMQITGVCASAATIIAMSCDSVTIAPDGAFGIHNARAFSETYLESDELRALADMVAEYDELMLSAYANKTKRKREEIKSWMDAEMLFTAEEALEFGFVDAIDSQIVQLPRYVSVAAKIFGHGPEADAGSVENNQQPHKEKSDMSLDVWKKIKAKFGYPDDDVDALIAANADHEKLSRVAELETQLASLKAQLDTLNAEKAALSAKLEGYKADETTAFEAKVKRTVDDAVAEFRISASQREAWEARLKADFDGTITLLPEKDAVKPSGVRKPSGKANVLAGKINPTVAAHLGLQ